MRKVEFSECEKEFDDVQTHPIVITLYTKIARYSPILVVNSRLATRHYSVTQLSQTFWFSHSKQTLPSVKPVILTS